jgi:hypothetical protein
LKSFVWKTPPFSASHLVFLHFLLFSFVSNTILMFMFVVEYFSPFSDFH